MELLLFILFMLFSVVSSLLERRKRKRQLENARQAEAARAQRAEPEGEEEEEVSTGWPFGDGKDPFEEEVLTRRFGDLQRLGEKEDESDLWMEELEVAPEPTVEDPPTEGRDALAADADSSADESGYATRRKRGWKIDAKKAREAIVYSEILGPPKALRSEER